MRGRDKLLEPVCGRPVLRAVVETALASRADGVAGAPANGCAMKPSISPDGRWVVFESQANNLTSDTNEESPRFAQIFIRDMRSNTTRLVSRMTGANGDIADADCNWPGVSDDGRYVSFNSLASNLSDEDLLYEAETPNG